MESAKIIQYDIPENIVLNPANAYVQDFVAHTNPLNVLKGNSLMTPIEQLDGNENNRILDAKNKIELQLDNKKLVKVTKNSLQIPMQFCPSELNIDELATDTIAIVPEDISMRRAIEIKHCTGLPIVLAKEDEVLGMLNDNSFYHALLGKHFKKDPL